MYKQLNNVEKRNRIMDTNTPKIKSDSGKDLRLVDRDGRDWIVENVEKRDQAFAQIIAFSDSQWQVVW
jgi:hypothetical protein